MRFATEACGSIAQSPWQVARLGIGRLFQDVRPFHQLTVLENVLVAFAHQLGEDPIKAILARRTVRHQERKFLEDARRRLAAVELGGYESATADMLSYGQQKLLAFTRLLTADPNAILLDEPTAGVNPALHATMLSLIQGIARQGKTVVLIEHNMGVVTAIADWVYFLHNGAIGTEGPPQTVLANPSVRAAYLGSS